MAVSSLFLSKILPYNIMHSIFSLLTLPFLCIIRLILCNCDCRSSTTILILCNSTQLHPPVWTLHWQHTHFFRNISKMYIKLVLRQYGLNMSPGMMWGSSRCCNIETTSLIKQSDHQLVVFHAHTHRQEDVKKAADPTTVSHTQVYPVPSSWSFSHASNTADLLAMLVRLLTVLIYCWQLKHPCKISKIFLTAPTSFRVLWHFATTFGAPATMLIHVWQS
jgi:hypothetical protein